MKYPTYKLGDILSYEQPTNYIVESTEYDGSYPTPVLTAGKSFILGYTNETKGVYDKLPVIIFDDFTTASQFVDFKFKVKSSAMKILSCNEEIADIKYMYYLMQITHIQSDTHKRYWISDYSKIPVSLPPLTTQRTIVSRIESLFAELDKAEEHLRTAQQQLKIYRQAVLNHWLNNEDGKWEMVKLGDVAEVNTGATPKRGIKDYWENGNIPWITSGEVNNVYITKATEFITAKAIKETNCKIITKGSLVIAMYGEGKTRGKCAELLIDAATNQALASITFNSSRVYKSYAKCFFERNYQNIRMLSSGGVQTNLNLSIIKNTILPLPPLPEQQRIVKEIESRLSQTEAAEARIAESLQQTEALRQSILKKAFSGELI
ncbi:MAG: restriction endonuclease subunit S [Paludibacteraceae bacterium]|nr:restriction endonuclease subunit S [Paludibacteraceae bacterium]